MLENKQIGFIGGGAMGEALMGGLLARNMLTPSQITVFDVSRDRLQFLKERYGVAIGDSGQAVAAASDILFLTIKPQVMSSVLADISKLVKQKLS